MPKRPPAHEGARVRATPIVDLALVLSTAFCIGMTIGLFPPLLALNVEARGFETSWNGLLGAMAPLAGVAVSPFVPRVIARINPVGAFALGGVFQAFCASLFPVVEHFSLWFALRFLMGVGMGLQWVVSESWVNRLAAGPHRGLILSIYVVIISAGLSVGPVIMKLFGATGSPPFMAGGALFILSLAPLLFARRGVEAESAGEELVPILTALKRNPPIMLAALADGFVFLTLMVLLPVYLLRIGATEDLAISYMTALFPGGLGFQIAIGYLLDRFAVQSVLAVACGVMVLCLAMTPPVIESPGLAWAIFPVMGAMSAGFYTAGLAGLNDTFKASEMSSGNNAFTMIWYIGALCGPPTAGYAMLVWEPHGILVTTAASCVVLGAANLLARLSAKSGAGVAGRA